MSKGENNTENFRKDAKVKDKKRVLKIIALFSVFIIAMIYSVFKSGVIKTIENMVLLVIFAFLGYSLFYLFTITLSGVLKIRRKRRGAKSLNAQYVDKDKVDELLKSEGEFDYDKKETPLNNLKLVGGKALAIIKKASSKPRKKVKKYYFVNFTLYDAIDIFGDSIDKLHQKVDGIFCFLRMQNKPLSFLEKKLENVLGLSEDAIDENNLEPKSESSIKKAIKKNSVNLAITLLKGQINSQVNDLLYFIATESVLVFGYSTPKNNFPEQSETLIEVAATDLLPDDKRLIYKKERPIKKRKTNKKIKSIEGGNNE